MINRAHFLCLHLLVVALAAAWAMPVVAQTPFDEASFDDAGFDDSDPSSPAASHAGASTEPAAGVNPAGVNPAGANPAGANPAGANPAGANPAASVETAASSESPAVHRRLIFVDPARESLRAMLELQLPDWEVRRVAADPTYLRVHHSQLQLTPSDAVVWIERSGDIERVALLDGAGGTPRTSTLPASTDDEWARAFGLVVEGLIREQAIANEEAAAHAVPLYGGCAESGDGLDDDFRWTPVPAVDAQDLEVPPRPRRASRWRTPLARDGWLFRFGWSHGFVPRRDPWVGGGQYDYPSGGVRVVAGRWLHRNFRIGLFGELSYADLEPEGVVGLHVFASSATRLRMGGGFEIATVIVSEFDGRTGNRFGWVGYRIGLPMELGLEINGRGGFFIHLGPTWTKAPYGSLHPGYQMSVEWEFN